jgi:two-component system, OmpR family, osmolarity sensor histidine kinase EnvZ
VEIRIALDDTVMRVFARRSAAYASNSEIFLPWMVGTSLVLITVAILFLRNQIRPILRLQPDARGGGRKASDHALAVIGLEPSRIRRWSR